MTTPNGTESGTPQPVTPLGGPGAAIPAGAAPQPAGVIPAGPAPAETSAIPGATPDAAPQVDAGAPAGPYDLPSDFQMPQAAAVPSGPVTDPERLQLEYYRRRAEENAQQNQAQALDNYERQAYEYWVREGRDEETARDLASVHRTEREDRIRSEMQMRAYLQSQQRVSQDIQAVARQYNVNPAVLGGFQRREDMMRHAAVIRYFGTSIQTMRAEIAALQKARVPEQYYAGGGAGVPTPGIGSYGERLKSGQPLPTAAEIDRMTERYARG